MSDFFIFFMDNSTTQFKNHRNSCLLSSRSITVPPLITMFTLCTVSGKQITQHFITWIPEQKNLWKCHCEKLSTFLLLACYWQIGAWFQFTSFLYEFKKKLCTFYLVQTNLFSIVCVQIIKDWCFDGFHQQWLKNDKTAFICDDILNVVCIKCTIKPFVWWINYNTYKIISFLKCRKKFKSVSFGKIKREGFRT